MIASRRRVLSRRRRSASAWASWRSVTSRTVITAPWISPSMPRSGWASHLTWRVSPPGRTIRTVRASWTAWPESALRSGPAPGSSGVSRPSNSWYQASGHSSATVLGLRPEPNSRRPSALPSTRRPSASAMRRPAGRMSRIVRRRLRSSSTARRAPLRAVTSTAATATEATAPEASRIGTAEYSSSMGSRPVSPPVRRTVSVVAASPRAAFATTARRAPSAFASPRVQVPSHSGTPTTASFERPIRWSGPSFESRSRPSRSVTPDEHRHRVHHRAEALGPLAALDLERSSRPGAER